MLLDCDTGPGFTGIRQLRRGHCRCCLSDISPTLWHFNDVFITSQRVSFVTDRRDNEQRCIQCISVVIMFPRPRLKTLFKTFNVWLKKRNENVVNFARNVIWTVQWSQLLVKTQVLDQNLQQIILAAICIFPPGFHTFYILWRGYLVISRQLTREFTPVWSQSPSSKYSNILKWVRERFNRLWVISMCFYWMLSISSISFKATIKSSFAFVSDWRISWKYFIDAVNYSQYTDAWRGSGARTNQ